MGHWYCIKTGNPKYTVIGKNGKERNTTLADAKKLSLAPSVTSIIATAAKPGLIEWQQGQILEAACEWPYTGGDIKIWKRDVMITARMLGNEAAKRGNEIHNELEKAYNKEVYNEHNIVDPVLKEMDDYFGAHHKWKAEASFSHIAGFGGKIDLYCEHAIIDFKTKSLDCFSKLKPYVEYCMQLAAYRYGLDLPLAGCYNIFISVTVPGKVLIYKWSEEELKRGLEMFLCLLKYWQLSNKYMGDN